MAFSMKNLSRTASAFAASVAAFWILAVHASANSSWVWLTESRPNDLLPFAIAGTLIAEILAVRFAAGIKKTFKVAAVTVIANLVSFAAPYLCIYINASDEPDHSMRDFMNKMPFYTVGAAFLFMTLVCEIPIVYNALKKHTDSKIRLAIVIAAANIVTTAAVAVIERKLCYGQW